MKLKEKSDGSLEMGGLDAFRLWLRNHHVEEEMGSVDGDTQAKAG